MAVPWICYSPIDVSQEAYDLVLSETLPWMRTCEFDRVLRYVEPIAESPDGTPETRSLAHYVVAESLRRRTWSPDVERIVHHAHAAREMYSANEELLLASYLVEGDSLWTIRDEEAAIDCLQEALAIGEAMKCTSPRWVIVRRTLAWIEPELLPKIALLDEIISSGTVWQEEVVDAVAQKAQAYFAEEGIKSASGDQVVAEILADPQMERIHYQEKLRYGLKRKILHDYETAVTQFTDVIESFYSNWNGIEDMVLAEAYSRRIDALEAIAEESPKPFDRAYMIEEDKAQLQRLVKNIREELDEYVEEMPGKGWLRALWRRGA